ncbi:uncharacterized protein JN550_007527 [Neoarthrinium moseri]|uniref:uncharacterized protein n=1 Tax=Neoarthrinium moseri TaxID=1658444 RepID=UPI001FDBAABD|nr:uncharacterized protein JN550_007527 [Neoarthrinium moseri]KAI1866674.1 hypothetical protein JN550_007527 [Neoarthrinium moseri]
MLYRGDYSIKDLRRDLETGLGWAHSTESVARYLETIVNELSKLIPRGSYRHTSSQDKSDTKKVVTTSFYKYKGGKIATCHAHGDGTWSIAFTLLGEEELKKQQDLGSKTNEDQLEVLVNTERNGGQLIHHGEIKNKPQACRGHISLNNDEAHRTHKARPQKGGYVPEGPPAVSSTGHRALEDHSSISDVAQPTSNSRAGGHLAYYQRSRDRLSLEQKHIASELAKDVLTRKEERDLFQRLKEMPREEQEQVMNLTKTFKSQKSTASGS